MIRASFFSGTLEKVYGILSTHQKIHDFSGIFCFMCDDLHFRNCRSGFEDGG